MGNANDISQLKFQKMLIDQLDQQLLCCDTQLQEGLKQTDRSDRMHFPLQAVSVSHAARVPRAHLCRFIQIQSREARRNLCFFFFFFSYRPIGWIKRRAFCGVMTKFTVTWKRGGETCAGCLWIPGAVWAWTHHAAGYFLPHKRKCGQK